MTKVCKHRRSTKRLLALLSSLQPCRICVPPAFISKSNNRAVYNIPDIWRNLWMAIANRTPTTTSTSKSTMMTMTGWMLIAANLTNTNIEQTYVYIHKYSLIFRRGMVGWLFRLTRRVDVRVADNCRVMWACISGLVRHTKYMWREQHTNLHSERNAISCLSCCMHSPEWVGKSRRMSTNNNKKHSIANSI